MSREKTRLHNVSRGTAPAVKEAGGGAHPRSQPARVSGPAQVSGHWLLGAVPLTIAAAGLCVWFALCLLFWQGSWQLLYHPAAAVARTPASAGLAFDSVGFATTDTGVPRLKGWWVPAAPGASFSHITALYLHGQDGNLGDTVDALARLHTVGVNVLAFDFRGYGQSQFVRPSEAHWRQDAEWSLQYLTGTRHIYSGTIVLDGAGLGANLALEVAAAHPELAGVILDSPIEIPADAIFNDPRARLVPAHLLFRDRYDLDKPASALHIPSLWFEIVHSAGLAGSRQESETYKRVAARKMLVRLAPSTDIDKQYKDALAPWLDGLGAR